MKKIIVFICMVITLFPIEIKAEDLTPNAKASYVMEYNTGKVVYAKNEAERLYPASMTKMMGLLLIYEAINNHTLSYDDEVVASSYASSMGGSQIFLEENETMSVLDLIKSICIASANDAMVAMSEKLYGSEAAFVEKMNAKVKELKLENTHFTNTTGLHDDNHYSCAKDMAIIAQNLLEVGGKKLLEITSMYEDYIREDSDKFWLVNTNKLIRQYEGVDGLKTGYTTEAQSCICVTAKKQNIRFIVVVMKEPDSKTRNNEVIQLLNYSFSLFDKQTLYKKGEHLDSIYNAYSKEEQIDLVCEEDVEIIKNKNENISIVSQEIEMLDTQIPYKQNDRIAKLKLQLSNGEEHISYLVSSKDIHKKSYFELFMDVYKNYF